MWPLLLSACSAPPVCTSFDDIEVTDPEGVATDWALDEVKDAIGDFRDWTGRAGVCVSEIRFVSELEPNRGSEPQGRYRGALIEMLHDSAARSVALHELCHGIDLGLEGFSRANPSIFQAAGGAEPCRDPTLPASEVYATTCERGPFALDLALEGGCTDLPRTAFVLEQTFIGNWERMYTWSPGRPLDRHPVDLPPDGYVGATVPGIAGLYIGREQPSAAGRALSVAWASPSGWGLIGGPTVGPEDDWFLVGGYAEDPVLLVREGDAGLLGWRVDAAAQEMVDLPLPATLAQVSPDDITLADGAWVWNEISAGEAIWRSVSLNNGEETTLPLPEGVRAGPLKSLPGGIVALGVDATGGDALLRWDRNAETWTVIPVPEAFHPIDVAALDDGHMAVRWGGDTGLVGFAWVEPTTGIWSAVREPCDAGRSRTFGTLGSVNGDVIFLEYPDGTLGTGFDVSMLTPP